MFAGILRKLRSPSGPPITDPAQDWISRGNSLLAQDKLEEALRAYQQAIAARPDAAPPHVNAGYVLRQLGRLAEAKSALQTATQLDNHSLDAHFLLGSALAAEGDHTGAAASLRAALEVDPAFAFAHVELAKTQERLMQSDEAALSYERAIAFDPQLADDVGIELARLLVDTEQWSAAIGWLDRVSRDQRRWKALRGAALNGLGQSEQALALLNEALQANPTDLNALHTRGNVFFGLQRYQEARQDCERLLAQQPDVVEVLSNCGAACQKLGDRSQARALLERALSLRPQYAPASYNLGVCLLELGECREAIACSERGLAFHPADANLHWNKAVGHLLLGELGKGWPEHEWRWEAKALGLRSFKPSDGAPMWSGSENVAGKTILLTAEQGLGDTIQFVRYAPLLVQRGAKVLLRLPRVLEPLFRELPAGCELSPDGSRLPPVDFYCPLLSLPLAFSTELDTVPRAIPYLRSDAARRAIWEQRLGARRGVRVGLVWSGNAAHKNDANRSISLAVLLAALPTGLHLVSLQKELRVGDEQRLADSGVVHFGSQLESFADTAALIDCMDLVLSVDTSVAHLTGALGRPLWLLLPFLPDWRWLLNGESSPWYPSARLFRQGESRRWDEVLVAVAADLRQLQAP
jgi:tetratricopeptide (TPR) repeat protein